MEQGQRLKQPHLKGMIYSTPSCSHIWLRGGIPQFHLLFRCLCVFLMEGTCSQVVNRAPLYLLCSSPGVQYVFSTFPPSEANVAPSRAPWCLNNPLGMLWLAAGLVWTISLGGQAQENYGQRECIGVGPLVDLLVTFNTFKCRINHTGIGLETFLRLSLDMSRLFSP